MSEKTQDEVIAVAEIGTSTVTVIIGRRAKHGAVVTAMGVNETRGLNRGEVVSQSQLAQSLANAVEEAEIMSGEHVSSLYMAISGGHCRGQRTTGTVPVVGRAVTQEDMDSAIEAGVAGQVKEGNTLLHKLVREWVVDGREGISRPEGMPASRLEVRLHLVTVATTSLTALSECAKLCNKTLAGVFLDTLAASEAVLTDVDKERGCVLVDIGSGTTDVAIWSDGALVHNTVIARGGDQLTAEVGMSFRVGRDVAERLKRRHGSALVSAVENDEKFNVPGELGGSSKQQSRKLLAAVLEPSVDEVLRMVRREVELTGYEDAVGAGFILTGGVSTMPALLDVAERRLGTPVRLGIPGSNSDLSGMVDMLRHPKYSVAVGLLTMAHQSPFANGLESMGPLSRFGKVWAKFRGYIDRML